MYIYVFDIHVCPIVIFLDLTASVFKHRHSQIWRNKKKIGIHQAVEMYETCTYIRVCVCVNLLKSINESVGPHTEYRMTRQYCFIMSSVIDLDCFLMSLAHTATDTTSCCLHHTRQYMLSDEDLLNSLFSWTVCLPHTFMAKRLNK